MNGVLRATLVGMLAVATACGGAASEATQKVTLLAADAPTEIVVSTTSTTSSTTTTTTTTAVAAETTIRTASETSVDGDYEDGPGTTTTSTTTTAEPVKETIPLAEEKVPPGIQMMDALEEFNGCLDATLGEGALVNQPAYIKALTLCAARSGIISAMQEFQTSRAGRTPEKIREDNEQFIALTGCLRSRGWTVSDPMPNADGSLGPGDDFRGPDGDLDMDDIRSCISELSLLDDE